MRSICSIEVALGPQVVLNFFLQQTIKSYILSISCVPEEGGLIFFVVFIFAPGARVEGVVSLRAFHYSVSKNSPSDDSILTDEYMVLRRPFFYLERQWVGRYYL